MIRKGTSFTWVVPKIVFGLLRVFVCSSHEEQGPWTRVTRVYNSTTTPRESSMCSYENHRVPMPDGDAFSRDPNTRRKRNACFICTVHLQNDQPLLQRLRIIIHESRTATRDLSGQLDVSEGQTATPAWGTGAPHLSPRSLLAPPRPGKRATCLDGGWAKRSKRSNGVITQPSQ